METTYETIIKLLRSEVCGDSHIPFKPLSDKELAEIYSAAMLHNIVHIVGSALLNNGLLKDRIQQNAYCEQLYSSIYRFESLCNVLNKVGAAFDESKIPYIPLKGAVIKELYPQHWFRIGCDVDILVQEKSLNDALKSITDIEGYRKAFGSKHDVSVLSAENIYVELHFTLSEDGILPLATNVLKKVWDHAKPVLNSNYQYELDDAMFYFYHIAHMAKHFATGGCGIRPFLDLWLINKSKNYITSDTEKLLNEGGLSSFEKYARKLSEVWFSDAEHDEITRLMENYIFNGGCFGSKETVMLSKQQNAGGKIRYIFSRMFVPYDELKHYYPIIVKHKALTPICEIQRLISLLFGKKRKFRKSYFNSLNGVPAERINDINFLFESVGF